MSSEEIQYWNGYYSACKRLLSSPRMNRPQREVIEEQALLAHSELEKLGVKFAKKREDRS